MKIPPIETKKKMSIDIDRARDRRTTVRLGGCLYPPRPSVSEDKNRDYFMESVCVRDFHTSW